MKTIKIEMLRWKKGRTQLPLNARTNLDVFVRVSTGVVVAVRLECDRRHVPLLSYTLNPS